MTVMVVAKQGIQIRQAEMRDIPWLLDELRKFDQFFGMKKSLVPNETHANDLLASFIDAGPFFVAERDYSPVGFIAGVLHPHPYNPDVTMLTETFWWVSESERGSRAGGMLLYAFTDYGRKYADGIVMTLEAKSPVNPKTLERRGFHLHESSYLLET
jgi:hypothetical protein